MTSSSHIFTVLAVVFALIGQAFASTVICCEQGEDTHQMSSSGHHSMPQVDETLDNANHTLEHADHASMQSSGLAQTNDCCGNDCNCPANACANYSLMLPIGNSLLMAVGDDPIISALYATHNHYQTSLFRPPIFV